MNKYIKISLLIVFIIICIIFTFFSIKNNKSEIENIYTSELLVYSEGHEYEIMVNNNTKETIFRMDDEEEIIYRYPRKGNMRMSVPNFNNIIGENVLESLNPILDFTYNVSFMDSCKYIKYLINEGYELKMYAINSQYMECFLIKDNVIKRLILFSDSLMIGDLSSGSKIPNISNYFRNYNYNGYFENKFSVSY